MSDPGAPNDDTQGLRADAGDPNRDRAYLLDDAPAQVDDHAVDEHLGDVDDETDHDAPTVAE